MDDTWTVEVVNLGKRPVAGVRASTDDHAVEADALTHLHRVVGALVVDRGLEVIGAERREDVGPDGIVVAARLTDPGAGGRVEVLLRRRQASAVDADDDGRRLA